jgi:hypothetical protein
MGVQFALEVVEFGYVEATPRDRRELAVHSVDESAIETRSVFKPGPLRQELGGKR